MMPLSASCAYNIDPLRFADIPVLVEFFSCSLVHNHVKVTEIAAVTIMTRIGAPSTEALTAWRVLFERGGALGFSTATVTLNRGTKCRVAFPTTAF